MAEQYSAVVETARSYYNSDDADRFYATVWGGEDIHIGLYQPEDSIFTASQRTVEKMAAQLTLDGDSQVLDMGAGYGGAARYLVKTYGCTVDCLNLSEVQNNRNRDMNREQGLSDRIRVIDGSFENVPAEAGQYDVVWSQDSFLHSGNRRQSIAEAVRVLKPGGDLIFTDPMQHDECPEGVLQPILDRIHLDTLGSIGFYRQTATALGLTEVDVTELTPQLVNHYSRVLDELNRRHDELVQVCGPDYLERMKTGLGHWVDGGRKGYLSWGILHFRKP